jgi:hypothetical protein
MTYYYYPYWPHGGCPHCNRCPCCGRPYSYYGPQWGHTWISVGEGSGGNAAYSGMSGAASCECNSVGNAGINDPFNTGGNNNSGSL